MDGRRRTMDITSRRFDLGGREDVGVGAFARRLRRRRLAWGTVGVVLVGAAWLLYQGLTPESEDQRGLRPIVLRCAECKTDSRRQLPAGQAYPMTCEKCEAIACRPLWQCRAPNCGTQFLPSLAGGVKRCPKCGSDQVGDVDQ